MLDVEIALGRVAGMLSGLVVGLRYATPQGLPDKVTQDEREQLERDAWFLNLLEDCLEDQIAVLHDQVDALRTLRPPAARTA